MYSLSGAMPQRIDVYKRQRINVLKQYESAYNERNNQKNDAYVREYVNHFTNLERS